MNEVQKPLNIQEAAAFMGLKVSYLHNLVHYGKLRAYRPGGKKLVFKITDLEKYLYRNEVGNHAETATAILNAAQKKKPRRKTKAAV
jgi:excisionase family DNA binding protein